MTKHAQDLNLNDIFYHNELKPWKVIEQPVVPITTTVNVKAQNTGTKRIKVFKFGRFVSLDVVASYPCEKELSGQERCQTVCPDCSPKYKMAE